MQFVPDSAEAVRAFLEAEDIARQSGQRLSSAHLLLALFTFPNRAQALLSERRINEDNILDAIRVVEDEPPRTVNRLRDRAREIASGSTSEEVDCLHLLIALTRFRDSFAYRLLERTETSLTALRNIAVSYVTGNMPRRFKTLGAPPAMAPPQPAPRPRVAAPRVLEVEPQLDTEPADEDCEDDEFAGLAGAVAAAVDIDTRAQPKPAPRIGTSPRTQPQSVPRLEDIAPTLAACGVDLTSQARAGLLDLAIGRDRELDSLVDIVLKRRANNPILVGPPGVGKTAIVEGLAVKIANFEDEVAPLHDRTIFALDTGALVAGTSLRGAFSERLGAIKAEVKAAGGQIVVFIDELHTMIGAGTSGEGAQDAANELKSALARGEFPCIGATTHEEFKKYIEKDAALERRFTPIFVEEPSVDEAILILEGAIHPYADHHQVDYSLDAIHAAVQLSHRFITERQLPDKAFAVADLAGSRTRRRGGHHVERIDIARVVNEWTGVPLERLAEADADRFSRAEEIIGEKLIGHQEVVSKTCQALRRGFAGFNGRRPISSFLFLGPTGVGKTELVKVLAGFLFGRRDAIVRIDMTELSEPHSVARLIGAQPGYVGFEEGGQLTEALRRRPFQIVLFDEIEKAHHDVLNLLLQILDEGQLPDARGKRVSFANAVVILTSNLGSDKLGPAGRSIGFSRGESSDSMGDRALEAARLALPPELWGRLDERLVFGALRREDVRSIAELQLGDSSLAVFGEREITLEWSEPLLDFLLENGGFSPETGARGMRQTIQRHVEGPLAELILKGTLSPGDVIRAIINGAGKVELTARQRRQSSTPANARQGSKQLAPQ